MPGDTKDRSLQIARFILPESNLWSSRGKKISRGHRGQRSGCAVLVQCRGRILWINSLAFFPQRILRATCTYSLQGFYRACNLDWRIAHAYTMHNRAQRGKSTSTFRQDGSNADGAYFLTSLSPYLVYILRVSSGILDSLARPCSHETFVIPCWYSIGIRPDGDM